MNGFPESPPRVRVEWLIAAVRVAIAVSALLAFLIDPPTYVSPFVLTSIFGGYLAYSVAVLWLVWSPVRFGRGWDPALHVIDLIVFVLAATMTDAVTSPFFASFAFIVVSASLQVGSAGNRHHVAVALIAYAAVSMYGAQAMGLPSRSCRRSSWFGWCIC